MAAITAMALLFRCFLLGDKSLWGDEMNMVGFATGTRELSLSFGNALPYIGLIRAILPFTHSDMALRLPAALLGTACIPALFWATRAIFGRSAFPTRLALVGCCLLAVSPIHLAHSQQVHSYAAFSLLSILTLGLSGSGALDTSRAGSWRSALALSLLLCAGLYLHFYFAFVGLGSLALWTLGEGSSKPNGVSAAGSRRWGPLSMRFVVRMAAVGLIVGLLALPLLLRWIGPLGKDLTAKVSGSEVHNSYFEQEAKFEIGPTLFVRALRDVVLWKTTPNEPLGPWAFGTVILLMVLGVATLWRRARAATLALLVWLLLPLLPIAAFAQASSLSFDARRLIFVLPSLLLFLAAGTLAPCELLPKPSSRSECRGVSAALTAALLALLFACFLSAATDYYLEQQHPDFRLAADLLREQVQPGDGVIVWKKQFTGYYYDRPMFEIREGLGKAIEIRQASQRIWYVRPQNIVTRDLYKDWEAWLIAHDSVPIQIGGGLVVSLARVDEPSKNRRLAEQEALLRHLIERHPDRWYLRSSLSGVLRRSGKSQQAEYQAKLSRALQDAPASWLRRLLSRARSWPDPEPETAPTAKD